MTTASPARIMEVGMGFWPAKVLLSAIELGLFTELGSTARTGDELQAALGLHSRANPDFFDALVALQFLDRDGDGSGGRYRNTAETARFLDRRSPDFMGLPRNGQRSPLPVLGRSHRRTPDRLPAERD
jgi:hypothetical protein